jgi:hypothetical protein
MNLNKLNKDQLINKIKDQENIITSDSYWTQIIKAIQILFFALKGIFLKFTMLTLLIKLFKNYKIIRKVLLFFNWIIISLFGFSIIDIYDSNLVLSIIEWIRSTHLYKILIEIFENKVEKVDDKIEVKQEIEKINQEIEDSSKSGSMRSNNQSIENINWRPFWTNEGSDEKISEKIENNYAKFAILTSLILLSGLTWFFWDDLKPFLSLNIFRKRKPDSSTSNENNLPELFDPSEEYPEYFREIKSIEVEEELYDLEVIRNQLEGKGKAVDYTQIEIDKWTDSPTTPKAAPSKLPSNQGIMLPISKE